MAEPARKLPFTYRDYAGWPADERWELIDGHAFNMAPAPTTWHQGTVVQITSMLAAHFGAHGCRVFCAPTDVLLLESGNLDISGATTVVQPDVLVVCDPAKVRKPHVVGAPDLVVEVTSPATAAKDARIKRDLYARAGVREYWLADPELKLVTRYRLLDSGYGLPDVFGPGDSLTSSAFPDLSVALDALFTVP